MKTTVAVYPTHEQALSAISKLGEVNYPLERVSLVGKTEIIEDNIKVKITQPLENLPLIIGAIAGPILGILTGIGVFALPGEAFYKTGIIIGGLGGLGIGTFIGGIFSLFITFRAKQRKKLAYRKHLIEGKYLVMVDGSMNDIHAAEKILHTEGTHLDFNYG